jgi:hypothetical protein
VRLSKIHSSKVSDKEKIDLLSGKITKSGLWRIRLLTKEEEMKYSDLCPNPECYRVWILQKDMCKQM